MVAIQLRVNLRIRWSALVLTGVLTLATAVPSAATPIDEEGLWYFDTFKVQDAHDEGITGEGVTIAFIDSQVNLEIPTLADADIRVQDAVCVRADGTRPAGVSTDFDTASHGTSALSFLVGSGAGFPGQTGVKGLAPDATVLTYYAQLNSDHDVIDRCPNSSVPSDYPDAFDAGLIGTSNEIAGSMHAAMDAGADIISISMVAGDTPLLSHAVARAVREDVIVVAGLPNEGQFSSAPARLNGVVSVNIVYADGEAPQVDFTDVVAPGYPLLQQGTDGDWQTQVLNGGTSYATPIVAGNLALAMQKYPDATPNQLIQSLIHNTGDVPHDLMWDPLFGYGVVITDVFLAADPTVYPDVNPLVSNFADEAPPVDDIWPGAVRSEHDRVMAERPWPIYTPEPTAPSPSPTPSADADSDPTSTTVASDNSDGTALGWLIPAIIIGMVLLIAIVTIVIVVIVRSNRPTGGPHGTQ